jgi:hypothetical protein
MEATVNDQPDASGAAPGEASNRGRSRRGRFFSPGNVIMAAGVGHSVWGLLAYRSGLKKIAAAGFVDSVGDGLFRTDHARDERAAAFWFMFAAPVTVLLGYLTEAAIRSEDRRTVATAGVALSAIMAVGGAAVPRSGFPVFAPVGPWMIHRARQLGRDQPVDPTAS